MALTKITQGVIKSNENYDTHNINSTGIITATGVTVNGDLNVSGVLTYDDVTNIDSVGIITAQSGIHVTGGSVGIGTDNPAYNLDFGESSPSTIRLVSENNGTAIRIGAGGNGNQVTLLRVDGSNPGNKGTSNDSDFGFSVKYMGNRAGNNNSLSIFSDNQNGATQVEAITVLQDGKIGIGTDNPDRLLHLSSNTNTRLKIATTSASSFGQLYLGDEEKFILGYRGSHPNEPHGLALKSTNSSGYISLFTGGDNERLRITSAGNIGIGTQNPANKLEVGGVISATELYVTSGGDTTSNNISGKFSHGGINSKSLVIGADPNNVGGNTRLQFDVDGTERLRITSAGRVGVNTTTPDDTFEVYDGGILAPSRRTISSVVRYGTGIQYKDTSGNQRPILHIQAYSRGIGTGSIGSNSVFVNGVVVRTTGRSWGLTVISGGGSNIGQVLHSQTYDVYGGVSGATNMVNDMATYDTNYNILIVNTYDEPDQNGSSIRVALRDNYYAKHAESSLRRYAYVHAWRNAYGRLGECHSATRNGSTFTNQGDNSKANAGISFTVIL